MDTDVSLFFETASFVAILKPPGLPFHQDPTREGLLQRIRQQQAEGTFSTPGPLYPLHRLDAVTSGLMLLARDPESARELSEAFQDHRIEKLYIALSTSRPQKKQGRIAGDMERSRRGTWKLTRTMENPAITRFVTSSISERRPGMRLFLLRPETGRTHQLRVAMKSLGAPILGDALYGPKDEACQEERTYLHACGLRFSLAGESYTLLHPPDSASEFLSPAFCACWDALGDPFAHFERNT